MLTTRGSALAASMLRDVEGNHQIEADHIVGDLLRRRRLVPEVIDRSILRIAYTHLKAYEVGARV